MEEIYRDFELSYRKCIDNGELYTVQTYKRLTNFNFRYLCELANHYEGGYSFLGDDDDFGGLGEFYFFSERLAKRFQEIIDLKDYDPSYLVEDIHKIESVRFARYGNSTLNIGMEVEHKNLGRGIIKGFEDKYVMVFFHEEGLKKLELRFLYENNLLSFDAKDIDF